MFEIQTILGKRVGAHGEMLYLIKWKGFDESHNTFEPSQNLNKGAKRFVNSNFIADV